MSFLKIGAGALALSLGLAGAASALPLQMPQRPTAQIETVQWGQGHYDRGRHEGWRHHGPRCWTERIVHRTPWGPRVDYRRICR